MQRILALLGVALAASSAQAQFWNVPANPVVLRMGDGVNTLANTGAVTSLLQFEAGIAGQSSPTTIATFESVNPTNRLIVSGTASSGGMATNSVDGNHIVTAGYDIARPHTGSVTSAASSVVPRTVGWAQVGSSGLTGTTSTGATSTTLYSGDNIRAATSVGGPGSDTWAAGTGTNSGIRYMNDGTQVGSGGISNNTRTVDIFNGQLFAGSGGGTRGIYAFDSAQPTSGGSSTLLVATGSSSSPYEFVFTRDSSIGSTDSFGHNVAYIADDRATSAGGGIQKWTWDGAAYTLAYTLFDGTLGFRGLAGYFDGTNNVLFAGTADQQRLVQVTDTGASSTFITLATAGSNFAFGGVALSPVTAIPEPSTYAMITLAVVGMAVVARRRKAALAAA